MDNNTRDLRTWRRVDVVQQLEVLTGRAPTGNALDDRRLAEQIALCEAFLRDMDVHSERPMSRSAGPEDEDREGPEAPPTIG